jgi:hypothetical protein
VCVLVDVPARLHKVEAATVGDGSDERRVLALAFPSIKSQNMLLNQLQNNSSHFFQLMEKCAPAPQGI